MAKTISQAQAEALAEGFLDGLGEEEFKPTKTLSQLVLVCGKIIEEAQNNLNSSDRVSTGALSESIKIIDPVVEGSKIRIDITMLYYWKFINEGVKGVVSKKPNSKYSFKNLYVSKSMLKALKKWVAKEGLKTKAKGQGKPISKRERKRSKIKTDKTASAAYAIGRSVKAKGLKKTSFLTKAIKEGNKFAKDKLGKSFALDIVEAIPKRI
jgi:hypothetical protein